MKGTEPQSEIDEETLKKGRQKRHRKKNGTSSISEPLSSDEDNGDNMESRSKHKKQELEPANFKSLLGPSKKGYIYNCI